MLKLDYKKNTISNSENSSKWLFSKFHFLYVVFYFQYLFEKNNKNIHDCCPSLLRVCAWLFARDYFYVQKLQRARLFMTQQINITSETKRDQTTIYVIENKYLYPWEVMYLLKRAHFTFNFIHLRHNTTT